MPKNDFFNEYNDEIPFFGDPEDEFDNEFYDAEDDQDDDDDESDF